MRLTARLLWVIFFCYAVVAALLFQKILLPLVPSLHAGLGLMSNDPSFFHSMAVKIAETIRSDGWGSLHIWADYTAGNVAVLAFLYVLFGNDPSLIIPINAAFHATGGVLLFLLACELSPGKAGRYGGVIAASIFVAFPSALTWYSQPLKDSYATVGVLLILFGWIRLISQPPNRKAGILSIFSTIGGMCLVAFVRPYFIKILFAAAILVGIVLLIYYTARPSKSKGRWNVLTYLLVSVLILGCGAKYIHANNKLLDGSGYDNTYNVVFQYSEDERGNIVSAPWDWQKSTWLPDIMEKYVELAAKTRVAFITYNIKVEAGSLIDKYAAPSNVWAVAAYMPRALQIGLFAPFPSKWFEKLSAMRLVAVFEMVVWYMAVCGIFLALYYQRSPGLVVSIAFSLFFMGVLAFVSPNVGTLYRIRYAYLFVLLLIGVLGWTQFFLHRKKYPRKEPVILPEPVPVNQQSENTEKNSSRAEQTRNSVANAGAVVVLLTIVGYIGFFLRDLIAARLFGIGNQLDALFMGMVLPMFLVTLFSMPLGSAIVPVILEILEKKSLSAARNFVAHTAFFITALLALLCLILYATASYVLPLMGWNFTPDKIESSFVIMSLFLPVLLLSGLVIIGNAVFYALGKFLLPSLAQMVVPIVAILTLLIFGHSFGIITVAVGMVIGQIANLVLVAYYLNKYGFSFFPTRNAVDQHIYPLVSQYLLLVAAAFFVGAILPINSALAATLAEGSVAVFTLGNKMVIFMTGLIGVGITSVMLPYFSTFFARNQLFEARRELSFYLLMANLLTIPVSVALYLASGEIAHFFYVGGALSSSDANAITKVLRFGVIQLPFFTCGLLIMKFATAHQRSGLVMLSSFVGLVLNVILSILFMRHLGVAGIALATTLSIAVSAWLLLILIHRMGHISWFNITLIGLGWMLYLTLVVCLYYVSYPGVAMVVISIILLLPAGSKMFSTNHQSA